MNKEIEMMVENYEMGFLTSHEFLLQFSDFLSAFGAHKCIEDKISEHLKGLADDMANMLKCGNRYNNMIEHQGMSIFTIDSEENRKLFSDDEE